MESRDRVFKGQRGLQKLLCRADGVAFARDGESSLPPRVSRDPTRRCSGSASGMEKTATDFRELDERFISSRRPGLVYSPRFSDDGRVPTAYLSSADKA